MSCRRSVGRLVTGSELELNGRTTSSQSCSGCCCSCTDELELTPLSFPLHFADTQSRYSVIEGNGMSILRIEPVRAGRDDAPYECVAENGVGDAVSAEATLTVYEGTFGCSSSGSCPNTNQVKLISE